MSKLSYGLNMPRKVPLSAVKPPATVRKPIFDDDSGSEDGPDIVDADAESVLSVGGIHNSVLSRRSSKLEKHNLDPKPSKSLHISQYGDLSSRRTTKQHAEAAQLLDPGIYDYDAVYDTLHVKSKSKDTDSSSETGDRAKRPKYMSSLLAAAEVRKRDQLRAKEKLLAKERELEGDDFADKEKFVTAAYKRQQEEVRKAEAEEALRERQTFERQRREGGGLKGMYKHMLERNDEQHAAAVKSVEEAKSNGTLIPEQEKDGDAEQEENEVDLARKKGALLNEDGQVVDKRQLLNAGLNAGVGPKASEPALARDNKGSVVDRGRHNGPRGRSSKAFEDPVLGKRNAEDQAQVDPGGRASKSRKVEDEILASLGL
ncbi:MAG: hypothetical protein LQ350_002165 [Teloschistes chrysophthalmus]|nr:MAG: hypothetical protein LQ350_002165 [Niorma chrysophthalma]